MQMVRLIYCSRPTPTCTQKDVREFVEAARSNNAQKGLTGVLCFDEKHFLQWLEGPRAAVNELYCKLVEDARHQHLEILDYGPINSRHFPRWHMADIHVADIQRDTLLKYVYDQDFDPYEMTGQGAKSFLLEIAERNLGKA